MILHTYFNILTFTNINMQNIGDALKRRLGSSAIWRSVTSAIIVDDVNNILLTEFGNEISKFARAVSYKNNVISIACLSSITAQEIRLHQNKILAKIRQKNRKTTVSEIKFIL